MITVPDEIKKWNICVQQSKNKHKKTIKFGFIDDKVVKDARRCYCAMAFLPTK